MALQFLSMIELPENTIGDPGTIDLFETDSLHRIETFATEKGAHTLGFDSIWNKVYAFLPQTHRAMVLVDR